LGDDCDIRSSPGGAEGLIIKPGQGRIVEFEEREHAVTEGSIAPRVLIVAHHNRQENSQMSTPLKPMALVVLMFGLRAPATAPPEWKQFKSPSGFSISYPANWVSHSVGDDFDIRSSPGGVEGIIIKKGQGRIIEFEEREHARLSMKAVIDFYVGDASIVTRRVVRNETHQSNRCPELQEVVMREPATPPEGMPIPVPYVALDLLVCEVNGRRFITIVSDFERDPKQQEYRRVGLRIAKSLQLRGEPIR
jgi:hypothetical protein